MDEDNLAKSLFLLLHKASKATQKQNYPQGSISYSRDLVNKRITASLVLPLEEVVNEETGEIIYKIADFLEPEASGNTAT